MADAPWIISTVAGTGDARATRAMAAPRHRRLLNNPFDLAFDPAGNLCFSDTYNHCIRRIDARTSVILHHSRHRRARLAGDGGPATQARMDQPYGIIIDRTGNIYVADRLNGRVRRIDGGTGIITTLAGDGSGKYSGDGGPIRSRRTGGAERPALDREHRRLFIADVADHRVRVIDLGSGVIATFAGTGNGRHAGDGGPAVSADVFGARAVVLCRMT